MVIAKRSMKDMVSSSCRTLSQLKQKGILSFERLFCARRQNYKWSGFPYIFIISRIIIDQHKAHTLWRHDLCKCSAF